MQDLVLHPDYRRCVTSVEIIQAGDSRRFLLGCNRTTAFALFGKSSIRNFQIFAI